MHPDVGFRKKFVCVFFLSDHDMNLNIGFFGTVYIVCGFGGTLVNSYNNLISITL